MMTIFNILSHVLAVLGVLTAGAIYGTDVSGALVMRSVWAKVDDRTMVQATGYGHYYGDRRFPIPGILSLVTTVLAAVTAGLGHRWLATVAGVLATVMLLVWLAIYRTVNAPINAELTKAAQENRVPENARALQNRWDSVINARVVLQGVAVLALCGVLALP